MKTTIYDVAREAGVSATTVSKVINSKGRISEETKEKVQRVIKSLHFQPNMLASAMKGKSTNTIALLVPDMSNPIYNQYLKHIEERGQEKGLSVVMCSTDNDPQKEAKHIALLKQKNVDGFIIASEFKNEAILRELIEEEMPLVLIAHHRMHLPVDSVTVDDYLGGYMATEHLLSLGHKRIGVIAENAISSTQRIEGYRQALKDKGVEPARNLIVMSELTIEEAEKQAGKLLDQKSRPTAIFGCNDILAIGGTLAARKRGIVMPAELAIIGFDNTIMSKIVTPSLSTISQPVEELGRRVTDILVERIKKSNKVPRRILLYPELVIRESTLLPEQYTARIGQMMTSSEGQDIF